MERGLKLILFNKVIKYVSKFSKGCTDSIAGKDERNNLKKISDKLFYFRNFTSDFIIKSQITGANTHNPENTTNSPAEKRSLASSDKLPHVIVFDGNSNSNKDRVTSPCQTKHLDNGNDIWQNMR